MKSSFLCLLSVLFCVFTCCFSQTPAFGNYNCTTGQWTINTQGAAVGQYSIGTTTSGANQAILFILSFNVSSSAQTSIPLYITTYSGQSYSITSYNSLNTVYSTSTTQSTCPLTLPNYEDEATRVFNLARTNMFGLRTIYRNINLDNSARIYAANNSIVLYNYTAVAFTSAYKSISAPGFGPNPGAVIQTLIQNPSNAFINTSNIELGAAYYNVTSPSSLVFITSTRQALCGNGVIDGTDICDDGNRISGDGCSSFCNIEENFVCTQNQFAETSVCTLGQGASYSNSLSISASTTATQSGSISLSPSSTNTASMSNSNSISTSNSNTMSVSLSNSFSTTTTASGSAGSSISSSTTSTPSLTLTPSTSLSSTTTTTASTAATVTRSPTPSVSTLVVVVSPPASSTNTLTSTPTGSSVSTQSQTSTHTATATATATATSTATATASGSVGASASSTSTPTASLSFGASPSGSESESASTTQSASPNVGSQGSSGSGVRLRSFLNVLF